jgi:hypothetical protein
MKVLLFELYNEPKLRASYLRYRTSSLSIEDLEILKNYIQELISQQKAMERK